MERLSNLISKQVLSLDEGQCIGYVINACLDLERNELSGLLICDEDAEVVKFLDLKNMLFNNDFIVIKSVDMLSFGENILSDNPIGKTVVSERGVVLGVVKDVEIVNKKISKLITSNNEISPKNIINLQGNYLIFSEKNRKKRKENYFSKIKKNNLQKVEILENKKIQDKSEIIPFKSTISLQKLIGRLTTSDIYGFNNELIIRKNQIITDKIIKTAKKHNKINYLMFNSK